MLKSVIRSLVIVFCCVFSVDLAFAQLSKGSFSDPSYDCAKVTRPLPVAICSSDDAAKSDWELVSAFWALYFSIDEASRAGFKSAQDDWFASIPDICALPVPAAAPSVRPTNAHTTCIANLYRNRAMGYRARLSGDALAEANLSPEGHKQIQLALVSIGLLAGRAEGVFGAQTRAAIRQFQVNNQFPQTGYLSSRQRQVLTAQYEKIIADIKAAESQLAAKDGKSVQPGAAVPAVPPQAAPRNDAYPAQNPAKNEAVSAPNAPRQNATTNEIVPFRDAAKDETIPSQAIAKNEVISSQGAPKPVPDAMLQRRALDAEKSDRALCSVAGSAGGIAACNRLIGGAGLGRSDLIQLILNRATSHEARGQIEQARADYNAILLIDPDAGPAIDGRKRTENPASGPPPASRAAIQSDKQIDRPAPSNAKSPLPGGPYLPFLAVLALVGGLAVLQFRRIAKIYSDWRARSFPLTGAARIAGIGAGVLVIGATAGYLWLGDARTLSAVPTAAQHVPLTSQAYVIVPNISRTLSAAKQFLDRATRMVDVGRLSKATKSPANNIQSMLALFQSNLKISLNGKDHTTPNGCFDFAREADLNMIGLSAQTSAAGFVGKQVDAEPIFVVGPVDKSRLSAFLANTSSRYVVDISTNEPIRQSQPVKLNIDRWTASNLVLCRDGGGIANVSSGSVLEVDSERSHVVATLDSVDSIAENASFDLRCSYELLGKKQDCRCEIWERAIRGGEPNRLGDCKTIGRTFGNVASASAKRSLEKTIKAGGMLPTPIAFNLPVVGAVSFSGQLLVRWKDDSLIIGSATALGQSLAGTPEAIDSSVIRDDTFVSSYRNISAKGAAFFGAARPDWSSSPTFFNRLVSVPIALSGLIDSEELVMRAFINFEPLDAAILQDISRDYSESEGEIPINSSVGSASVRIGDDKVSQYVNFADRFILNRIVEGLSTLDTEDAATNLKSNFIRYILRKIGLNAATASGGDDSFANQPHQIMFLDGPPNAWAPSIAVAVKFQSVQAAHTFLCAEPQRLQRNIDERILLNSARAAKKQIKSSVPSDLEEYRKTLTKSMAQALGATDWNRYQALYDFDPFLMKIAKKAGSALAQEQRCQTRTSEGPIDGKTREIYYLSPTVSENMKQFYYRIPELQASVAAKTEKVDIELDEVAAKLRNLSNTLDASTRSKAALAQMLLQLQGKPRVAALTWPWTELKDRLQSDLDAAGVKISLKNWNTVADVYANSAALGNAIDLEARAIDGRLEAIAETMASKRIQRAQIFFEAERIGRDVSKDEQRIVAFVDEDRRLLFIASSLDVLKRAAEQAIPSNPDRFKAADLSTERVRFFASADNTVQSFLDLTSPEEAIRWRDARLSGPLLPFEAANLGVSGRGSGIAVSLNFKLQRTEHPQQ